MTDRKPLSDQTETPEDVATLYSWANLHGAKYRDFSAARAQTREMTRLRMQEMLEDQERKKQEAEAQAKETRAQGTQAQEAQTQEAQTQDAQPAQHAEQISSPPDIGTQEAAETHAVPAPSTASAETDPEGSEVPPITSLIQGVPLFQTGPNQSEKPATHGLRPFEIAAQYAAQQAAERAAVRLATERIAAQNAAEEAQQVADQVAQRAARLAAEHAARRAAEQAAAQHVPQQVSQQFSDPAPQQAAQHIPPAAQPTWQPSAWQHPAQSGGQGDAPLFNAAQPPFYPQPYDYSMFASHEAPPLPASQPQPAQPRETVPPTTPAAWSQPEPRESSGRPAWLMNDRPEAPQQAPAAPVAASIPQAPEDTLQGSRERMASRWFALRSVFEATPPVPEAVREPVIARAPSLAVFSLAGGVGKTSLVATLGRALSARGERVLLVDTAAFGLLPFYFGARDQRPGMLRTFSPPGASTDAPIQMVTLDPEGLGAETAGQENLTAEISKYSRGVSRVIVDLATASGATTRRILRMQPLVLVPVVPDMNSVVSVSSIDAFFERNGNPGGKLSLPYYILNQFDPSLPLHLDVREVLREQLGDRLLPIALRRAPAISEALAEGMTVMDYAPNSALAEDFGALATWVKNLSAPATTTYRGVRWSER